MKSRNQARREKRKQKRQLSAAGRAAISAAVPAPGAVNVEANRAEASSVEPNNARPNSAGSNSAAPIIAGSYNAGSNIAGNNSEPELSSVEPRNVEPSSGGPNNDEPANAEPANESRRLLGGGASPSSDPPRSTQSSNREHIGLQGKEDGADAESTRPRSSVIMLARSYDWVTESSPLFEMYQQVSARFKRPRASGEDGHGAASGHEGPADLASPAGEDSDDAVEPPVSNKRRRKEEKPKLADLKKMTRRPELVEWFDADAQDPSFLVVLKTLPHAVQVPSNWRNRSDSPNFAPQGPYELPQNVADTGIMDMRDPNAAESSKPGRLDVDYESMHSAFFEREQPLRLTGYGQVREPKLRTLAFKPRRASRAAQTAPESMSARLRDALGLKPGDDAPWAQAMQKHGPPPGYERREQVEVQLWGVAT